MNNNDFRVQFPLWNIALWFIFMIWTYGVIYAVDLLLNGLESHNWNVAAITALFGGTFLMLLFLVLYAVKIHKHNKRYPHQQIDGFSLFKPGEFIDDDEMLQQVTQNATRKVYVFYWQFLPLIILLMLFPFNRYVFIVALCLVFIIQNLLYYLEVRKYFSGDTDYADDTPAPKKPVQTKKNLRKTAPLVVVGVLVLVAAITATAIFQMKSTHEANLEQAEKCLDNGGTVVSEETNWYGLNSVTCTQN